VDYFGRCTCVPPSPGFEFGCVALCDSPAGQHTVTCNQRAATCFSQRGGELGGETTPDRVTSGCDICRIAVNEGGLGAAIYTDAGVPDVPTIPDAPARQDVPPTPFNTHGCACEPLHITRPYDGCIARCRTVSGASFTLDFAGQRDTFESCRWNTPASNGRCRFPSTPTPSPTGVCDVCVSSINEGCGAAALAQ